jgi:hypothetical protein
MSVLGQSIRTSLAATLCAGFLAFATAPALAVPIGFTVTVNTSSLSGNPAAPFYLDFQLTNGAAVSNSATISNFSFGGGSAFVGESAFFGPFGLGHEEIGIAHL